MKKRLQSSRSSWNGKTNALVREIAETTYEVIARLSLEMIEMREYEILYDTGEARNLVAQINRMANEGWQAKSMEREVS